MILSHLKSAKWLKTAVKKFESLFGLLMFVSVNCFLFTVKSQIIKRPSGLEYALEIWKIKLLLKSMATPPFLLVQQLNKAW